MTLLELIVTMLVLSLVTSIGVVGFRAVTDRQDKNQALGNLFIVRDAQRRYASLNDSYTPTPTDLRAIPANLTVSDAPSTNKNSVSMAVGSRGTLALASLSENGCVTLQVPPLSGPLSRQTEQRDSLPISVLCDARSALPSGEYQQTPGPPSDALVLSKSSEISSDSQSALNSGSLSDFADLGLGVSDEPDSSDPAVLSHDGEQYLYIPNQSGNYVSTPDSIDASPDGDIDVRACISPVSWSSQQVLVEKQGSYTLSLTSSGALRLSVTSGGLSSTLTSSTTVSLSPLQRGCVRVSLDADNGSGAATASFFASPSGVSWRGLGSPVTTSPSISIDNTSSPLVLFQASTGFSGRAHSASVLVGNTVRVSFDARDCGQTVCISASGESYTITRSSSGLKAAVVDRDMLLFDGLDDLASVAHSSTLDIGPLESMTVVAAVRFHGPISSQCPIVSKRETDSASFSGSNYAGWTLYINSLAKAASSIYDGSLNRTVSAGSSISYSEPLAAVLLRVGASGATGVQQDGSRAVSIDGALSAPAGIAVPVEIGKLGSLYCPMEFYGVAIYKRDLSISEVNAVYQYLRS
jgi:type II secretory pathway pseudopilin PulG